MPDLTDAMRPAHPVLACEVCHSTDHERSLRLRFKDHPGWFQLWQCRGCGLIFNWPRLPDDALHGQYDGDYYFFHQPPARRWSRTTQIYLEQLLPLESAPARTLLDVGCGRGDLLALARARGWQVCGLELSPQAAREARREHGLDVRVGTVESHAGALGRFDAVICTDVIEHVASPRRFVQGLHRLVRPGGHAIVETPNWGSAWRRLGGPAWLGLNRFHIYLFNAHNLRRLMTVCGFHHCRARTSTNTAHCEWGVRPELGPALQALPAGLRWRAQRLLNRLTPPAPSVALRRNPPASINDALGWIERHAGRHLSLDPHDGPFAASTWHDNLAVIGRA